MFTLDNTGVLEVVLWATSTIAGQMRLVFQWKLLTGGPLDFNDIAADLEEWLTDFVNQYKSLVVGEISFDGFSFNTLDDNFVSGFVPFAAPIVGTNATDPLPSGVAALLYMPTGVARRQLRKYLFGLAEDTVGAFGNYGSATLTTLTSIAPLLLVDQVLTNGTWQYGHALPGVGASWVTPNSMTAAAIPAYQRRRKQNRGI